MCLTAQIKPDVHAGAMLKDHLHCSLQAQELFVLQCLFMRSVWEVTVSGCVSILAFGGCCNE